MTTPLAMPHSDLFSEIIKMVEASPTAQSVNQSIRLSRLKLGSALEHLEQFEPGPAALEQLRNHGLAIGSEIESLLETIRQCMGR